jgi:4-amino-4-deoxy-L-arabinose transferase-like glycosyltransferase
LSWRRGVAAIVVVALIARVVVVLATPGFKAVADSGDFDRIAVSLVNDGRFPTSGTAPQGPTAFRPPLFPLALAAVYEVVGTGSATDRWEAGRLVEAALGALVVLLTCLIALRLWGRRVALIAAGIAAVYPPLVLVGSSLLSESLFIPFVLGSVLAALVYRDSGHRWRWAVLSGVLAGLGALTRGNGIVLLVPLVMLVWGPRPWLAWRSMRVPAALLAATLLTLAPWTIRNIEQFHAFVPLTTETGYALEGVYNPVAQSDSAYPALWLPPATQMAAFFRQRPTANEAQVSSHLTSEALTYVKQHPGSVLRTLFWSVARLFNLTGTGLERYLAPYQAYGRGLAEASVYTFWLALALAIAAVVLGAASAMPRALWAWPLMIVLSCLVFAGDTRYRSPADPFVILLIAAGISAAISRWRRAPIASAAA